jgi:hypothetical protein
MLLCQNPWVMFETWGTGYDIVVVELLIELLVCQLSKLLFVIYNNSDVLICIVLMNTPSCSFLLVTS